MYHNPSLTSVIDELIAKGDVVTCAGSLQAEDPIMLAHMEKMEGGLDSFTGMPIALVKRLLVEAQTF